MKSNITKGSELLDAPLSSIEREILQHWSEGKSLKRIAEEIGLPVKRVSRMLRGRMAEIVKGLEDEKNRISNEGGAQADAQPRGGVTPIAERKLEQMLLQSGLLSAVPARVTDFTPYRKRKPVRVKGKPVSETIIEERR